MSKASRKYLEMSISTASPEELVLRTYDVLIMASKTALEKLRENRADIHTIDEHLRRAQLAVAVLMGGLNLEVGELAKNLLAIYEFWHWQLSLANVQRKPEIIERLLPDFVDFRKTWAEVIRRYRTEQAEKIVRASQGEEAAQYA
jgi:flagellar protein FliS